MSTLRVEIIALMHQRDVWCTWWFKGYLPYDTRTIRRELEKMEKDGIVTSDHHQVNNTKWSLVF